MPTSPALERFLSAMEYPATREDLLREARRDGLSTADCAILAELPEQNYSAAWSIRYRLAHRPLANSTTPAVSALSAA